jgi:O-antigen/teichoic acid export membrane protein
MRRALSASLSASLLVQLANVVSGIALARTLGPSSRGVLAAVVLWPSLLAAVGMLGIPDALTFRTARGEGEVGLLLGTGLVISAVQSTILIAIGFVVVPSILRDGGAWHGLLFLAFIPMNLAALSIMGVLNGLERYRSFQGLRTLVTVLATCSIITLAAVGRLGVGTAVGAYLLANAITLIAAWLSVRGAVGRLEVSRSVARGLIVFGSKSQTSGVSSMLNERLDQLVISAFLAPAQLGYYVVAVTLTSLTSLVGTSVGFVALPAVSRLTDRDELLARVRFLVVVTAGASIAVSAPLIVLAPIMTRLFFGSAYLPTTTVCRILLAAVVMLSVSRALAAMLKGLGQPIDAGIADGIGLVVTIVCLAVFLPAFGLMGAALASALAYAATLAWMIHKAAAALKVSPIRLVLPLRSGPAPVAVSGADL